MSEQKGIKETVELLKGLGELAIALKKVGADGKVNFSDLPTLIGQLQKGSVYVDAVAGVDQIPSEAKDLDSNEAKQILEEVLKIAASVKAA